MFEVFEVRSMSKACLIDMLLPDLIFESKIFDKQTRVI